MILRLASRPIGHLERCKRHPLDRGHHKVRQVILRHPSLQVRRQKKGLVAVERHKVRHPPILAKDGAIGYPNPTGC